MLHLWNDDFYVQLILPESTRKVRDDIECVSVLNVRESIYCHYLEESHSINFEII